MKIALGSRQYVLVPPSGPPGALLGPGQSAAIALMPDDGSEPTAADLHTATWVNTSRTAIPSWEAGLLVGAGVPAGGSGVVYPAGEYMAWLQIGPSGSELPLLPCGRVRIGDTRG